MKRTILGVIVAVGLFSQGAIAQVPGYPNGCLKCGVYSYIDTPADPMAALPILTNDIVIEGWGFECESGQPANRVDVWYSDASGVFTNVDYRRVTLIPGYTRADVFEGFRSHCPNVSGVTGFSAVVEAGAVPIGTRVLIINVWRGPYYQQSRRVVVIR